MNIQIGKAYWNRANRIMKVRSKVGLKYWVVDETHMYTNKPMEIDSYLVNEHGGYGKEPETSIRTLTEPYIYTRTDRKI